MDKIVANSYIVVINYLSDDDAKILKEVYELSKAGKLKHYSIKEARKMIKERIAKDYVNISLTEDFIEGLGKRVDLIAEDSEARADKFADDIFAAIQSATFMPKKHRKNEFLDDENARDRILEFVRNFYGSFTEFQKNR